MRLSDRNRCRTVTAGVWSVLAMLLLVGGAWGDTTLLAWDVADEDLWSIDTALPISSTFIGGGNASFVAEIEYGFGVVYGSDTAPADSNLKMIDPATGQIYNEIVLSYPPEGNVLTALEFVGTTLYAGLTTRGGQGSEPTYLATVDLVTGFVTVVGATGGTYPYGGLAYDVGGATLYAISAGGSDAELFTVDMATGAATSPGIVTVGGMTYGATALEFGDDGVLYSAPRLQDPLFGHVFTIDPATALGTDLGDAGLTQGVVALTFHDPAIDMADTTLHAWDTSAEDLWTIATASPITSTFIGGGNATILAEIEAANGVIYGADTFQATDFHKIDPQTGLSFDILTLTYPPEGNVLTALEFVGGAMYAGLTTQGGGSTYLATVDLMTGDIAVVGATGVDSPFGGLAYEESSGMLYAVSSGGSPATLYTVDMGTGAATMVAPVTFGAQPFWATALEFGDDGLLYTAPAARDALFGHVLTINTMNGVATSLGSAGMDQGPVALTWLDTSIFADGFELGDTSAWSSTTP